jgi:hypothetical protein
MKLKYKKIILLITMSTMLIGLCTFSLLAPITKSSANSGSKKAVQTQNQNVAVDTTAPSVTPSATSNPDVITLKQDAYPKINKLVEDYYNASVKCDMKALANLVTNIKHIDQDVLRAKYEFIEGFQNIQCYTVDGPVKGTYRVYVYSDLKIANIDTLAPGLIGLNVITAADGSLRINLGELDAANQAFIKKADSSDAVMKLNDTVTKKFNAALSQDKQLSDFYKKLEGMVAATPKTTNKDTNKDTGKATSKSGNKSTKKDTKKSTTKAKTTKNNTKTNN